MTQTAGEFKEKLEAASLELVTTAPSEPVMIMADGRRMMRIYDNLMNNICKYAQSGTRVYLTLEVADGIAVTTFKNTSAAQLGISADELVERFVRGDSSRTTEGNGLGLSIAKSMTELQGGTFDLEIDGDLFKVRLGFPVMGAEELAALTAPSESASSDGPSGSAPAESATAPSGSALPAESASQTASPSTADASDQDIAADHVEAADY